MDRFDRKRFEGLTVHQNPVVEHLPQQRPAHTALHLEKYVYDIFPLFSKALRTVQAFVPSFSVQSQGRDTLCPAS